MLWSLRCANIRRCQAAVLQDATCRHASHAVLAPLCKQLADEQQRVDDLKADLLEEREAKERLEREAGRAAAHAADVRAALAAGGGRETVARLAQEAASLREQVHVTLPQCAPHNHSWACVN